MTLMTDLYTYLSTDAGLSALISTRLYPDEAPESASLPYVVYSQLAQAESYHLGGNAGLPRVTLTYDIYAATAVSRDAVCSALFDAVDAYQGLIGSTDVRQIQLENRIDTELPPVEGAAFGDFRSSFTIDLWYRR